MVKFIETRNHNLPSKLANKRRHIVVVNRTVELPLIRCPEDVEGLVEGTEHPNIGDIVLEHSRSNHISEHMHPGSRSVNKME